MKYDLRKTRAITYKILKHLNQDSKEAGNIKLCLDVDKFTSYYETLQSDTNLELLIVTVKCMKLQDKKLKQF